MSVRNDFVSLFDELMVKTIELDNFLKLPGAPFQYKDRLSRYEIPIVNIRRSWHRLILITGIPVLYLYKVTNSCGRLNKKMSSYQYMISHHKDKTVSRPSYLHNGNHHTRKDLLYIETRPCLFKFCRFSLKNCLMLANLHQPLCEREIEHQGPLLLTWFNFNPSMDK